MKKKKEKDTLLTSVIWCILITEASERFSYYGMRAILVLYFTNSLHFDESTSIALFSFTTCLAYGSPILGAFVADDGVGRYRTILYFMCIYGLGLFILTNGAIFVEDIGLKRTCTFFGLILCCLGTGGIKPCVSAFGADQISGQSDIDHCNTSNSNIIKEPNEEDKFLTKNENQYKNNYEMNNVRKFFSYFYFCINVGAVTSIITIPIIKVSFGFGIAFLTQTVFLFVAIVAFTSKSQEYVHRVPDDGELSISTTFHHILLLGIQQIKETCLSIFGRNNRVYSNHQHTWIDADNFNDNELDESEMTVLIDKRVVSTFTENHNHYQKNNRQQNINIKKKLSDAAQVLHILPILSLLPIFWLLYDQQGSVWTLQASRMYLPFNMQPEQMNMINPLEIMIFIPLFENFIYPFLEKCEIDVADALGRMSWGMFLCALSFFLSGVLESSIQYREDMDGDKINVLWQLPQITILSVAEIFVSITGLEFAYSTSPTRLKAIIMALYLLTTSIGNFIGGVLYSSIFKSWRISVVMHVCGVLMIINLIAFCFVARWWKWCEKKKQQCKKSIDGLRDEVKNSV